MTLEEEVLIVFGILDREDLVFGHGTDNAYDEAVWLTLEGAGIDPYSENMNWSYTLNDNDIANIKYLVKRRINERIPLAYLVNRTWFAGHEFFVDERVIIPRSHLGELINERFHPYVFSESVRSILDLCTGSGCIAIALAFAFPNSQITASDINVSALEVAKINVEKHSLEKRINLVKSDIFSAMQKSKFDLIIANPPYVQDFLVDEFPKEYKHEPRVAFLGGANGIDIIKSILKTACNHLTEDGLLFMEVGSAKEAIEYSLPDIGFTWISADSGEQSVFMVESHNLAVSKDALILDQ